jgi:hypothetical protein
LGAGRPIDGSKKFGEGREACSRGSFSLAVEGCRSCECRVPGVFGAVELHQSSVVCCELGETAQVLSYYDVFAIEALDFFEWFRRQVTRLSEVNASPL